MTDKTPPFVGVRRFTTEYVIPEDRIRIALERQDDTLVVLWLTRRLMVRLVPQILKVLETLPKLQGAGRVPRPSDNAQRQSQIDALGKLEQQSPVLGGELPDSIESHLATGLSVRMTRAMMLLDFKVGEDLVQTLPFPEDAIRQWLGMLHATFRKAGWNEDIWPTWITAKGWDQGPDALRLN